MVFNTREEVVSLATINEQFRDQFQEKLGDLFDRALSVFTSFGINLSGDVVNVLLHAADVDEIGCIAGRVQVPDIIVATLDGAIQDAKTAGFSKGRALKDVLDNIDILIDNKRVPLPPGIVGTATQQLAADKRFRKQLKAAVRIMFSFAWDEVVPLSPIDQQLQQQQ